MSPTPTHDVVGIGIDEWIDRVPNELLVDAVGLWQIVPVFQKNFGLSGERLEHYVRLSIAELLKRGALPVEPTRAGWEVREDLALPPGETVEKVVRYWKSLNREPGVDDIWFSLPPFDRDARYDSGEDEAQSWASTHTWCDRCAKADLGMSEPRTVKYGGDVFVEGRCNKCGTEVRTRIVVKEVRD